MANAFGIELEETEESGALRVKMYDEELGYVLMCKEGWHIKIAPSNKWSKDTFPNVVVAANALIELKAQVQA